MTEFNHLEIATDEDDYNYVKRQSFALILAVEEELKSGKTPAQIQDWYNKRYDYNRDAMGKRVLYAARHIQRGLRDGG